VLFCLTLSLMCVCSFNFCEVNKLFIFVAAFVYFLEADINLSSVLEETKHWVPYNPESFTVKFHEH